MLPDAATAKRSQSPLGRSVRIRCKDARSRSWFVPHTGGAEKVGWSAISIGHEPAGCRSDTARRFVESPYNLRDRFFGPFVVPDEGALSIC